MADGWTLKILSGPEKGKTFPLRPDRTLIGQPDGHIQVGAEVHAEISYDQVVDTFYLKDFKNSGTFKVNDKPLTQRHAIQDGDRINFGSIEAVLESPSILDEPFDEEAEPTLGLMPVPADDPSDEPTSPKIMPAKRRQATAKSRQKNESVTIPAPTDTSAITLEEVEADPSEVAEKKERAEREKFRPLTETPVPIALTNEALKAPEVPASAGKLHYSPALKPLESTRNWSAVALKVAAALVVVGGVVLVSIFKSAGPKIAHKARVQEDEAPAAQVAQSRAAPVQPTTPLQAPTNLVSEPVKESAGDGAPTAQVQEVLLQKCQTDADFCTRTGIAYYNDKAYDAAIMFYTRACNDGRHGLACAKLGGMASRGEGMPQSDVKSFELFSNACELGVGGACANVAVAYDRGIGIGASPQKAVEYYVKACRMNEVESCRFAGLAYKNGNGVDRSPASAKEFFKQGCNLGNTSSCDQLNGL